MRVTEQQLAAFQKNSGRATSTGKPKGKKYANTRVKVDGIWFDSKLESRRYLELKLLKAGGQVEWFLRQVPIDCGGGVTYRVDFLVKWRTTLLVPPRLTFEDTTGVETQAKLNKLKQVKALHGIEVVLVKAAGGR